MQLGLVTPPGVLAEYVARVVEPAGHRLAVAPDLPALFAQSTEPPRVVLFAPLLDGRPAAQVLAEARHGTTRLEHTVYFGLDATGCEAARRAGFTQAICVPFQAQELLSAIEATERGKLRVLLVDDSDLIHKHTVPLLAGAGYEVDEAWDGEDGLARLHEQRPDLVLTDVEMPKLDGFAFCRVIKTDERTADIPVVICSSLGEARDLEQGFDAGADDYLVKPVVLEELVSRLHALLASRLAAEREEILVVDDSAAVRHLVTDCLRRQGFRVIGAVDGEDGLVKALAAPPDLVLTDYDMPRKNGFELVLALRREPRTRGVPLIMLTARGSQRDQAQMRAAGLTSYLVKPFSTDKCLALVERVLAEARLARYKEGSRQNLSEGAVRAIEAQSRSKAPAEIRAEDVDSTLLFSDFSGFTSLSAELSAREVVELLNSAFDVLCGPIKEHGGDIDKFIGDAIMAVFEERPDFDEPHPLRAARAAWTMQQVLAEFNRARPRPLIMRIGLNSGPIVRGHIGSQHARRDYTCIGDVVNRAQRHESKCPLGGVLLSRDTYLRIAGAVEVDELPGLSFKNVPGTQSGYVLRGFVEKA